MEKSTRALMTAAFGGLLLAATVSTGVAEEAKGGDASGKKGECHGVNSCKGTGECGGDGHGCHGKNECKGKGWISMTKADCEAKGGKFKDGGGHAH
ncbi:MAG TPA: hypothetical protein VEC57_16820 [Candidatus Limnocylindrales bacterium]|nr:hypothetical protein [Candidatus Limnocylindrales bacterium]